MKPLNYDNYFRLGINEITGTARLFYRVSDRRCVGGSRIDSIPIVTLNGKDDYYRELVKHGVYNFLPNYKVTYKRLLPLV